MYFSLSGLVFFLVQLHTYMTDQESRIPSSIERAALQYEILRAVERIEYGEDFDNGPGYKACIAGYFERELGEAMPNNELLDVLAKELGLPRDRIVPVMAGSCDEGEYLHADTINFEIQRITPELDIVITPTAEEALAFRKLSPIILPYGTVNRTMAVARGEIATESKYWRSGEAEKESVRSIIADWSGAQPEQVALHLGSSEILKALCKGMAELRPGFKTYIPLPNYADIVKFVRRFDGAIMGDDMRKAHNPNLYAAMITESIERSVEQEAAPDVVYLSLPNNPLGYTLTYEGLAKVIAACPEDTRIIVDTVSLSLEEKATTKYPAIMPYALQDLQRDFPNHHIVLVDSLSKNSHLTRDRIGFAAATHVDDQILLKSQEPPRLAVDVSSRMIAFTRSINTERWTISAMEAFYHRLVEIQERYGERLTTYPSLANFCIVDLHTIQQRDAFYEAVQAIDASDIPAKDIIGIPKHGSGEITHSDIASDGVISSTALDRSGMLGLPETCVRLCSLSSAKILDALERALQTAR